MMIIERKDPRHSRNRQKISWTLHRKKRNCQRSYLIWVKAAVNLIKRLKNKIPQSWINQWRIKILKLRDVAEVGQRIKLLKRTNRTDY